MPGFVAAADVIVSGAEGPVRAAEVVAGFIGWCLLPPNMVVNYNLAIDVLYNYLEGEKSWPRVRSVTARRWTPFSGR
jgi:hypothetical protein